MEDTEVLEDIIIDSEVVEVEGVVQLSDAEQYVSVANALESSTTQLEYIDKISTSLTIIMIVVVVWFCAWSLRSWRTWTSKIGRKL